MDKAKGVCSKEKCCTDAKLFPKLEKWQAVICFIINCLPGGCGIGTMISGGCAGKCMDTLLVGLAQWLLSFIIVGWIWSIIHGWTLFKKNCL